MKFPLVIVYNIIAFNITAVALSVQTDFPVLWHASIPVKVIVWVVAVGAWVYSYKNRRKVFELK
jgi:hypothetical protein